MFSAKFFNFRSLNRFYQCSFQEHGARGAESQCEYIAKYIFLLIHNSPPNYLHVIYVQRNVRLPRLNYKSILEVTSPTGFPVLVHSNGRIITNSFFLPSRKRPQHNCSCPGKQMAMLGKYQRISQLGIDARKRYAIGDKAKKNAVQICSKESKRNIAMISLECQLQVKNTTTLDSYRSPSQKTGEIFSTNKV